MANCKRKLKYHCLNDCRMQGCPGHKGELHFQSCSNSYRFIMNGRELYFEENELQAMIHLIKLLNRADCVDLESEAREENILDTKITETINQNKFNANKKI